MKKQFLFLVFCFFFVVTTAQETVRAMFYNILDFPEAIPPERPEILGAIIREIDPDIFMVCELQSEEGADIILETSLNAHGEHYARAPFIPSRSGAEEHQQLVFYKRKMFTLEAVEALATSIRDINYYQLKLNTADHRTDPVLFDIFVTHLKSSPGAANEQMRLQMVQKFTEKLNDLPADSFVLFSGDFNLYSSLEPAYLEMTNPDQHITMADPLDRPGHWHENMNFMDIHSQSTRIYAGPFGAGAGGGLDDRFDFIMISENMLHDPKLNYIPNSYKAIGNNGNCFKNDINNPDCDGFYSHELRNNLFNMSDHLPIVLDLETNKEIVLQTEEITTTPLFWLRETLVRDELVIATKRSDLFDASFEIYNIFGQKILDFSTKGESHITINVEALSAGVYFVKSNDFPMSTLKFIKSS